MEWNRMEWNRMEWNRMEWNRIFSNKLYIKVMNNILVDLNTCYRSCDNEHSKNLINAKKILDDFESNHTNTRYSEDDLTKYRYLQTNVDNLLQSYNACRARCIQPKGGGRTRSTTQQTKNKINRRRHTRNARRRGRGQRTRRDKK